MDAAKLQEIQKIIDPVLVKEIENTADKVIEEILGWNPDISDLIKRNKKTDKLVEDMYRLYDKYYTCEELKAVNDFYDTPAGKKFRETAGPLMDECKALGEVWAREIFKNAEKLIEEYNR